jgi:hypothetical protein
MKLPKIFVPNKDLEERTEELLEEQELKPKLDPKITAVDEILRELENNPKYYNSSTFNSNFYVAINQKGYGLIGGRYKVGNTYFIKTKEFDDVDVFIRVFEKNNMHYYFATTKTQKLEEFLDKFDDYKTNKIPILSMSGFREVVDTFYLTYLSGIGALLTHQLITYLFNIPSTNYNVFYSLIAGMGVGGFASWMLKRRKFKKNEKQLKILCNELILDEKEAVKRALK